MTDKSSHITSDSDQHAAAEDRLQLALDSIHEAQRLVEQATQALSRVDGMIPEWKRAGSDSDRLSHTWYAVSAAANRLRRKGRLQLD